MVERYVSDGCKGRITGRQFAIGPVSTQKVVLLFDLLQAETRSAGIAVFEEKPPEHLHVSLRSAMWSLLSLAASMNPLAGSNHVHPCRNLFFVPSA